MNSDSYIKLLKCSILSLKGEYPNDQFFFNLDVLRKEAASYIKEVKYWNTYPRHDMSAARLHGAEIAAYCREVDIIWKFFPLESVNISKGLIVRFYYKNIEITDIILV